MPQQQPSRTSRLPLLPQLLLLLLPSRRKPLAAGQHSSKASR
jgi:hypothetical protein